jgi:predicted permease
VRLRTPPKLAQWLLRRTLPEGSAGDTILGDLLEEFRERTADGQNAALWYWLEAVSVSVRYRGRDRRRARRLARSTMRISGFWQSILSDIRYAGRTLRQSPAFLAVAVLSIALGVGANTAIFTLVDQVLLRQLPVTRPEELTLVTVRGTQYGSGWGDGNELSYPMYEDLRGHNEVFTGMFCRFGIGLSLNADERIERVASELVSGTYFPTLGVTAARGRVIEPDDDTAGNPEPVVVLSHAYWISRFAADPAVVGRTLRLSNNPFTVIGVAQPAFHGTNLGNATQVFVPIRLAASVVGGPLTTALEDRRMRWLNVFGRLRSGLTPTQAQAGLQPFYSSRLAVEEREPAFSRAPATVRSKFLQGTIVVNPAGEGKSDLRRQLTTPLWALMGIVGMVLLIACANVANLLLARATTRQREVAIRLAIGASRRRIVQQLLIESVLLALIGGAAGLVFAGWGSRLLLGFFANPDRILTVSTSPDGRVLAFTLAVSAITGVLFGLAPAWQSAAPAIAPTLQSEAPSVGGGRSRLRRVLVVSQVALSLVLLIGAGLFIRTLHNLISADAGFDTAHILSFIVDPGENGYDAARAKQFLKGMVERLQASPGVIAAGAATHGLLEGGSWNTGMTIEGRPLDSGQRRLTLNNMITPGYFNAMSMHLVSGRAFGSGDERMATAPRGTSAFRVAIANEMFVKQYLDGEPALGRHVGFGSDPGTPTPIEIVGIVSDAKYTSVRDEIQPQLFFPILEWGDPRNLIVFVRTHGDPAAMMPTARAVIHDLDPVLPLHDVHTLEQKLDQSLANERLLASLSAIFGLLATLLAMVGLYGVVAYMVTRRTREIGIRMAIGAVARDVVWLILHDVVWIVAAGIALALPLAWASTRLLQGQLYGVTPIDPAAIAAAVAVLLFVAAVAGLIPARRAARMNPTTALRHD